MASTAEIHTTLKTEFPRGSPGVAVGITRAGEPLFHAAFGTAHVELDVALEPWMLFRIGSLTKPFTATCALRLVEDGRLDLLSPVSHYLPELPEAYAAVTMAHLLSHTAGLPSYTERPDFPAMLRRDLSVAELVAYCTQQPLELEPGTKRRYSNTGYVLVGTVIERVTGKPFEAALREYVLVPLELHATCYGWEQPILPGRVAGYVKSNGRIENAPYLSMTLPYASGGLVSNTEDILRWHAALLDSRFLDPSALASLCEPTLLAGGTKSEGSIFGMRVTLSGSLCYDHSGSIAGFSAYMTYRPEDQLFVCCLANCEQTDTRTITHGLLHRLPVGRETKGNS